MIFIKNKISKKGFTLIEALVAISILMVAIAGPMTMVQKGLSAAFFSRDQMTASFLVQDAIEAVKNIRDIDRLNYVTDDDWLESLSDCICIEDATNPDGCNFDVIASVDYCNIDTTEVDFNVQPGGSGSETLKIYRGGGGEFIKYGFTGAEISKFIRLINIKEIEAGKEAVVKVRVIWNAPGGDQIVEVENFIYNIRDI